MRILYLFLFLITFKGIVFAGQSVTIVEIPENGNNGLHYEVTLDFGGSDSDYAHRNIGKKYAEAILQVYSDYEQSMSIYLRESVIGLNLEGVYFADVLERVADIREQVDADYNKFHQEMLGMNDVFNSYGNGRASSPRLLYFGLFPEDELTLEEVYILNLIASTLVPYGCSSLGVYDDMSATGDTMITRQMDYFSGVAGISGHLGKLTRIPAIVHYKNLGGGKKDFISITWLGLLSVHTGFNKDGLYEGLLYSVSGEELLTENKDSAMVDIRHSLETHSSIDEAANFFSSNSYGFGFNLSVADPSIAKVLEYDMKTDTLLRDSDSILREDGASISAWSDNFQGEDAVVIVNSFLLDGHTENHITRDDNVGRLNSFTNELTYHLSDDNKVDMDELQSIMSYGADPTSVGDIFKSECVFNSRTTLFSLIYHPAGQSFRVFFMPYNKLVKKPDMPDYRSDYIVDFNN